MAVSAEMANFGAENQTKINMNRFFIAILAFMALLGFTACTANDTKEEPKEDNRIMVAYFSASPKKNTKAVAEKIATATGGVLHEIVPEQPYTEDDLNWQDENSRSSKEKDRECRPAVKDAKTDLSDVQIVYLGYPNWWGVQPMIINTFIDANLDDLKNKIIIPFSTSGGSGIEESIELLKSTYPELDIRFGRLLNGATDELINSWVSGNPQPVTKKK